jgi:hypothetical protein
VSQGTGRPEERERDTGEQLVIGAVRTQRLSVKFVLIWAWFMVCENNYSSNVKDHRSPLTDIIIVKSLKYCENYPIVKDTRSEHMLLGKWRR